MPYRPEHKAETRARIVENARLLFNRHGYDNVTIDMVMEAASLTRGGFYGHFRNKQELFAAAVASFLMGRGARWRADLFGLARARLQRLGLTAIGGGGLCTHGDPVRFPSHRRDGVCGRMAAVIWKTAPA